MRTLILGFVVLTMISGTAESAVMVFTNRGAWQAAVGTGISTVDFEGLVPAGGSATFADLVLSGVDFGRATVQDSTAATYIGAWGTGAMLVRFDIGPVTTSFSAPVTAFGFDFGASACIVVGPCGPGQSGRPGQATLVLSTGEVVVSSGAMPPLQFIGLISSVPVTSFTATVAPTFFLADNFSFGPSASVPVPEPASLVLLSVGLLAALTRGRCRQSL